MTELTQQRKDEFEKWWCDFGRHEFLSIGKRGAKEIWQAGRSSLESENAELRGILGGICGSLRNSNLRYELVRHGEKLAEWKAKAEAILEEARGATGEDQTYTRQLVEKIKEDADD